MRELCVVLTSIVATLSTSCGGGDGANEAGATGGSGTGQGGSGGSGSSGAGGQGGAGGAAGESGSAGAPCSGFHITEATGTMAEGTLVTIHGCGFGTKSEAAPLLWDTFEQGAVGAPLESAIAVVGAWQTGAASDIPVYSDAAAHGGGQSSYHDFVNNYAANLCLNESSPRVYMEYWALVDYITIKTRNYKPWRFYGDNDDMQMNPVWFCEGSGGGFSLFHGEQLDMDWDFPGYAEGSWLHFQLTFQESSPGEADGTVYHEVNHVRAGPNSDQVLTRVNGTSFDQIRIGHYWAQDGVSGCDANPGAHVYIDDVYIDRSWARVEIGDASAYDACTHREVQLPQSWTGGGVSIIAHLGSFSPGDAVFLFVIDDSGRATDGFPVELAP